MSHLGEGAVSQCVSEGVSVQGIHHTRLNSSDCSCSGCVVQKSELTKTPTNFKRCDNDFVHKYVEGPYFDDVEVVSLLTCITESLK